jgi:3D (Asp-Asp-Asp) domain-containing protein
MIQEVAIVLVIQEVLVAIKAVGNIKRIYTSGGNMIKKALTTVLSLAMLLMPSTIGEGEYKYSSPFSSKIPLESFKKITSINIARASPEVKEITESKKETVTVSRSENVRKMEVLVTAYDPYCVDGCKGKTSTGYDVSNTIYKDGMRIVAVDKNLIKLHSRIRIYDEKGNYMFTALAEDVGGAIKGEHIDLLVKNASEASKWGKKHLQIEVLD